MTYGNENKTFEQIVRDNGYTLERTRTEQVIDAGWSFLRMAGSTAAIAGIALIAHLITRPELSDGTLELPAPTVGKGFDDFSDLSVPASPNSSLFENK